ncbi:SURF1 family protein [Massilia sp.]|uniref:SURF1 family protein n=1 Tax=Massilia sp. TaxID=1882437 RepID=UPI0028A93CCA|nr:SURF1 family protein [Massilia sp.]
MRLRFRFRSIPFLATVVLVALGIALGNWQLRRAHEKEAIAAAILERGRLPPMVMGSGSGVHEDDRVDTGVHPTEYRRVRVTGEFVAGWPLFLDNRPHEGRAGFYLAMPFKIAGSDRHVLVLRGWLPRDPREYTRLPKYETPRGLTTIEGILVASAGHVLQLGTAAPLKPGALVQNLEVNALARASGLRLEPLLVQQTGPQLAGEVLVRNWPAPDTGIDKHRGYAVQWYALAAMAALFFVITGFRSGRKQAE